MSLDLIYNAFIPDYQPSALDLLAIVGLEDEDELELLEMLSGGASDMESPAEWLNRGQRGGEQDEDDVDTFGGGDRADFRSHGHLEAMNHAAFDPIFQPLETYCPSLTTM